MSQDVALQKNENGIYDLVPDGADFKAVDGLDTAITLSLFTNARANAGAVKEAYSRQGWVGNIFKIDQEYELGSELWILDQARIVQDTINQAENFAYNCLSWMIRRGIVESIQTFVIQQNTRKVYIQVDLFKNRNLIARYITVWRSTNNIE